MLVPELTREKNEQKGWPFNFVEEFRLNSSNENSNKCSKIQQIPKLMLHCGESPYT